MALDFGTDTAIKIQRDVRETTLDYGDSIQLGEFLFHSGDIDTYIQYEPDRIKLVAGGAQFIDAHEGATDTLLIGYGFDEISICENGVAQLNIDSDGISLHSGTSITEFSSDSSLSGNSNSAVPTEQAVKTYVDNQMGDISSDQIIENDTYVKVDDPSGKVEFAINSAEKMGLTSTGLILAAGSRVNEFSSDSSLSGNSNSAVPTEQAVKTYVDNAVGDAGSGTKYWSCPGINFIPNGPNSPTDWQYDADVGGEINAGTTSNDVVYAPVFLPHDAVVTSVCVYGTKNETFSLRRRKVTDTSSITTMASGNQNSADTSINSATIDNSQYIYYLYAQLDTEEQIWGAVIRYTI